MRLWSDSEKRRNKSPKCLRLRAEVIRALDAEGRANKRAVACEKPLKRAYANTVRINDKYERLCIMIRRCPHGRDKRTGKCKKKR